MGFRQIMVASACTLAITGCAVPEITEHQQAQQTWQRQGVDSYRYGIIRTNSRPDSGNYYHVTVTQNRVSSIYNATDKIYLSDDAAAQGDTIDDLIDEIELRANQGYTVEVKYNASTGVPENVSYKLDDDWGQFTVTYPL